jgi:hypothetical protein
MLSELEREAPASGRAKLARSWCSGREHSDGGQMLAHSIRRRCPDAIAVFGAVGFRIQALEVIRGIVERIAVAMVDMMPPRDRTVRGFPDFLMQEANAGRSVPSVRPEIAAMATVS